MRNDKENNEGDDMTWNKIEDYEVIHHWKCLDCDEETRVYPDWYQDNGTPVCAECDRDMDYQYTECNK